MGLRSAEKNSSAAFISSLNTSKESIISLSNSIGEANPILKNEIESAFSKIPKSLNRDPPKELQLSKSQKVISEHINNIDSSNLYNGLDIRGRARFYSCQGTHGSAIINAPLSSVRGSRLTSQEFSFFLSTRLGLSNICNEGEYCRTCGSKMDSLGYHISICKTGEASVSSRHNAIRNVIFSQCQRAAWNPKLEVTCANTQIHKSTPADIYIPVGPDSNPIALDVTICQPLAQNRVQESAKTPDHANLCAQRKKLQKYSQACSESGITFKPLAIEFYGRLSPDFKSFVLKLATAVANRFELSISTVSRDIETRVMVALIRATARAVMERVPNRIGY